MESFQTVQRPKARTCPICNKPHGGMSDADIERQIDACRAAYLRFMTHNEFRRSDDREVPVKGAA
jgi:hypothetical protein